MMQNKALSLSIENLFTDRCHIRLFQEKDLERFIQYHNNLAWMQYQGFKGLTSEQYRQELLQPHSLSEGIQLAVADRQTDILLGDLYLRQEKDCCWIGYTISPDYARQGYGFEAVEGLIQRLFAQGISSVKAGALPQNTASIALLQKLGFHYLSMEQDEAIYCRYNIR